MSPSILKSANLSKSIGKQLGSDPRLVSHRIHSVKGITITAEGGATDFGRTHDDANGQGCRLDRSIVGRLQCAFLANLLRLLQRLLLPECGR